MEPNECDKDGSEEQIKEENTLKVQPVKVRFNLDYLRQFCEENGVELLKDYTGEKITCETRIVAKCNVDGCNGEMVSKSFRQLVRRNNFTCEHHSRLSYLEKVKATNLKRRGVEYPGQDNLVMEKVRATNLERYGAKCSLQNEAVKNKIRATNLERYGTPNPAQNKLVMEKVQATNLEKYGAKCSLQNEIVKNKIQVTNVEKYGTPNPTQNKLVMEKVRATNVERYGTPNPAQNKLVMEKVRATNVERYGTPNPAQNKLVMEKVRATNLKRYGTSAPFQCELVKDKIKTTNLEKYGCANPFQCESIKDIIKATNFKKYGTSNPMQNAQVAEKASKSAYKAKTFTFPFGSECTVQGYEPFALNDLLFKEEIHEDDIITARSEVPEIWYVYNDKKCRYYVDIFIHSQNRCIEVKSTWTIQKKKDVILAKQEAVKQAGFTCEIWVYNGKGERVETLQ